MKTKYFCEECNKSFDNYRDGSLHEIGCFSLQKKQEIELDKVVSFIKIEYKDQIKDINYSANENKFVIDGGVDRAVHFKLTANLMNGNKIIITDGMICLGNLIEGNVIIETFDKEIKLLLPTFYEGLIIFKEDEDGYGGEHLIGDIPINTLISRLEGKKVRFEVIN